MTAARLTTAEARALGIDVEAKRTRTTRRTARAPYHTRCMSCGAVFTTQASEDRHVSAGHARFELVIPKPPPPP